MNVIFLFILFLLIYIRYKMDRNLEKEVEKATKTKICPLHKWAFKEQPGMPGITYTQCEICKMIPGQD